MTGAAPRLDPQKGARLERFARAWWPLFVVGLLGAWFRYHDLSAQVVLDDEWHSLFRGATEDLVTVATEYARIATSIPMNVFNKVLLDVWGYSEVSVRLVTILATFAMFAVLPSGIFRVFGSKTMAIAASILFACLPFWIFYGMSARPYAAYVLLLFVAYLALYRMLTDQGLRSAVTFGVSAALAVYFHLYALPALAGAALFVVWKLVEAIRRDGFRAPEPRRLLLQTGVAAGLTGALLVVLLLPAVLKGVRLPPEKDGQFFDLKFAREAVELLTGARYPVVAWLLTAAALFGIWLAARKNRSFMTLLGLGLLSSLLLTVYTRPNFFHVALVTWRYNLTVFLLYFVGLAACIDALIEKLSRFAAKRSASAERAVAPAVVVLLGLLVTFASPTPRNLSLKPNNFRLHSAYQENYSGWDPSRAYLSTFFGRAIRRSEKDIPSGYSLVRKRAGSCRIVEYPYLIGDHQNPYYFYQLHHRCDVLVAYSQRDSMGKSLHVERNEARLRFGHIVDIEDVNRLEHEGVDFVMVHLDLEREAKNRPPAHSSRETERVLDELTQKLGAPVAKDDWVWVFEVRGERG